jgi:hypothetical protein
MNKHYFDSRYYTAVEDQNLPPIYKSGDSIKNKNYEQTLTL